MHCHFFTILHIADKDPNAESLFESVTVALAKSPIGGKEKKGVIWKEGRRSINIYI